MVSRVCWGEFLYPHSTTTTLLQEMPHAKFEYSLIILYEYQRTYETNVH